MAPYQNNLSDDCLGAISYKHPVVVVGYVVVK